jgi:hypothetical protein
MSIFLYKLKGFQKETPNERCSLFDINSTFIATNI